MNSTNTTIKEHYVGLIESMANKLEEVDLLKIVTLMQTTIDSRYNPYEQLSKRLDRCKEFAMKEGVAIITSEQMSNKELAEKFREEYERASPACPGVIIKLSDNLIDEIEKLEKYFTYRCVKFNKTVVGGGENKMIIFSFGDKYHEVSVKIYNLKPNKIEYCLHWTDLKQKITHFIKDVKDYDGFVRWFDEFN